MTLTRPYGQLPVPFKPHKYQLTGARFLLEHGGALLLWDPGCGKSAAVLMALRTLKDKGMLGKVLILSPLRVMASVWRQEAAKWDEFKDLTFATLHGPHKDEVLRQRADIYLMNYEGLTWLLKDPAKFKKFGFDTLVMDEVSKMKHIHTKRFKQLKPYLSTFTRRWGLTGSPAANGLLDLFGICYAVDSGRALGPYITHYRQQYFNPSGYMGYDWVLKQGADQAIYERIRPMADRISAEDELDLPDLVFNNILVDLPPSPMRVYKQMEDLLIAQVQRGVVTAANAAAAVTKCWQIANGGVYHDPIPGSGEEREVEELHTAKVEALKDLVDELQGSPLLVAYEFEHDLKRIRTTLGAGTPHIGGGVSAKRGATIIEAWNRGELPVLLAHPATLAHGVNLQQCGHHICWYALTWNREHYDQLIARIWRQGSKARRVFVHHIVANGTIDEAIKGALASKKRTQDALLDALRAMAT